MLNKHWKEITLLFLGQNQPILYLVSYKNTKKSSQLGRILALLSVHIWTEIPAVTGNSYYEETKTKISVPIKILAGTEPNFGQSLVITNIKKLYFCKFYVWLNK